jgi:hypothetical protein
LSTYDASASESANADSRNAMNNLRVAYAPRPDATPEAELSTLAAIYKLVLNSANRNAAGVSSADGDDEKARSRNDSLAKTRIP